MEKRLRVVNYMKRQYKVADSLKIQNTEGKIVYGGGGIVPDILFL
jgi:hypothetical protein